MFSSTLQVVDPSLVNLARVKYPTLKIHYPSLPWVWPLPSNSDHQDYSIFSRGSLYTFICHCYWEGATPKVYHYRARTFQFIFFPWQTSEFQWEAPTPLWMERQIERWRPRLGRQRGKMGISVKNLRRDFSISFFHLIFFLFFQYAFVFLG